MKSILIVDNDSVILDTFSGLLKSTNGFLRVHTASSIHAAKKIFDSKKIQLVLTGMHLSEIDIYELLDLLAEHHPEIRVIVMTTSASSMLRTKTKQMATVTHFDHALDIGLLTRRVFTELQIDYGGQLRGLTLASFLQMLELEERSCTLLITTKGKTGTIYCNSGKPIAAEMGSLKGKPAALNILTWQNVVIDIDYADRKQPPEFNTSLMNLLLESGRLLDEKQSQRRELRRYNRYDCLVGVDYDISDWTYQCYLRDISEGGAYIETEQPVKVGQKLIVSIASPALERTSKINATVVRRDPLGIGVCFSELTLQQKQVIRSLTDTLCSPIPDPSEKSYEIQL